MVLTDPQNYLILQQASLQLTVRMRCDPQKVVIAQSLEASMVNLAWTWQCPCSEAFATSNPLHHCCRCTISVFPHSLSISYTSGLKQKTYFVFAGLQKLLGIWSYIVQLLHISNTSLSSHIYFHTDWMQTADQDWWLRHGLNTVFLAMLFKKSCEVSGHKQTNISKCGCRTPKRHGSCLLWRNAMQVWAQAAFMTFWQAAREGWWQADGLSMVSAPCNLLVHTTRYRTCLCACSLQFISLR